MWSSGRPATSFQMLADSVSRGTPFFSSPSKQETWRRVGSRFQTLVKSRVGSSWGTTGEDGTNVWPCCWVKNSMNSWRICWLVFMGVVRARGRQEALKRRGIMDGPDGGFKAAAERRKKVAPGASPG